jgi:hypothetical protein
MTVQTTSHGKRSDLGEIFHATHVAVTLLTTDAAIDMTAVGEIDEIGELVDPFPGYRLIGRDDFSEPNHFGFVH